jgi:hypothetical protein
MVDWCERLGRCSYNVFVYHCIEWVETTSVNKAGVLSLVIFNPSTFLCHDHAWIWTRDSCVEFQCLTNYTMEDTWNEIPLTTDYIVNIANVLPLYEFKSFSYICFCRLISTCQGLPHLEYVSIFGGLRADHACKGCCSVCVSRPRVVCAQTAWGPLQRLC